jgi:hypothetical protein
MVTAQDAAPQHTAQLLRIHAFRPLALTTHAEPHQNQQELFAQMVEMEYRTRVMEMDTAQDAQALDTARHQQWDV